MSRNNRWTFPVAMLGGVAVPMVTLGNYILESVFVRLRMSRYLERRALGVADSAAGPVLEAA